MNQTIEVTAALREIIKSSIREVLAEERISLIQVIIPTVSPKELSDIKKRYGAPADYNEKDFADKTSWFLKDYEIDSRGGVYK